MELRPGYKQTEVGVIPEEWEVKSFDKLFEFRNGVNADKASYGQGVRFINVLEPITYSHIYGPEITGQVSLPEPIARSYAVRRGDVLFNRTSETQEEVGLAATYLGTERVVFGGFVIRGRPIDQSLNPIYSGYALRAPVIRSQIISMGQGAIRSNIGQQSLSLVIAPVPPISEQRAIAGALGDVDALLGVLDQFIAKKRDLKQAAMQQLLTGKIRLPGFGGEWQVHSLGDGISLLSGHHVLAQHCNTRGEGVPYLTGPADFPNGKIQHTKFTKRPKTLCSPDDILVTVKGSGSGNLVIADGVYCVSRQLMAIRVRDWHGKFIYYSLLQNASQIKAASTGLIPGLSRSDILEQPLPLPTRDEQTAIAAVLSDMDAELEALEQRLTKTRALKQGMMQELLTGKTRLTVS
jgi:type I restriction enzyme, S subunit